MTTSSRRCELVLELQKKLHYKFSNILLLHEALTHSFDSDGSLFWTFENSGVSYRKKNYKKLRLLGKSVLKFTVATLALLNKPGAENEGDLTKYLNNALESPVLTRIGREYSLEKYIQVAGGCHYDPNFSMESLFSPVIQAIFGAIFIDAGGSTSDDGIGNVFCVFLKLWIFSGCSIVLDFLVKGVIVGEELESLDKCFPPPPFPDIVKTTLRRYNPQLKLPDLEELEVQLKYSFERGHLLEQALTHDSVHQYDELKHKNVPDYQRLEFFGDAVFELVICEYLFWHFFNDTSTKESTFSQETLAKYTGQEFQKEVTSDLSLVSFVRKPNHVNIDAFNHDFLEAIIGAVYVDSQFKYGLRKVRAVLISLCRRNSANTNFKIDSLVLPYTTKTFYGSRSRLQKDFERYSSTMPYRKPPLVAVQVVIENIREFERGWSDFCASQEEHEKRLNDAINFERKHGMDEVTESQAFCNAMEFNRGALYTQAAIQSPKLEIEDDFPFSFIPESASSSTYRRQNNISSFESYDAPQETWVEWARGMVMKCFRVCKGLGEVVGMLTLAKILCGLVSPSSYISALIYVISMYLVFTDDLFVFGNMLW